MSERGFLLLFGLVCGGVAMTMLAYLDTSNKGGPLSKAVEKYDACIRLGAPQQNCLDEFIFRKGVK